MALSIIFGDGTKDLELELLQKMQTTMQHDAKARLFYLVPNHIKFQSEISVLERLAMLHQRTGAVIAAQQVQIFSLSRLAWFYMNEDPLYRKANLSDNAMTMIMTALLNAARDDLQLYGSLVEKPGFIAQFSAQLLELQQSGLSWDDVAQLSTDLQATRVVLSRKLHDLALIGRQFSATLGKRDQYLTSNLLGIFERFLFNDGADLAQHHFYVFGYAQMTNQERGVIEALIEKGASLTIALPADEAAKTLADDVAETDLFYRPKHLAQQLRDFANQVGVTVTISQAQAMRQLSPTMQAVSKFWIETAQNGITSNQTAPGVAVWETSSRYQEAEQMTRYIRQMVARGQARYRDFLLLTPDLKQYQNMLPAIFNRFELPFFMDVDRSMSAHPLVAMLQELLSLAPRFDLKAIMLILKTELLIPAGVEVAAYREALALTENYALAKNVPGWKWQSTEPWHFEVNLAVDEDEVVKARMAERDAQLELIHTQVSELLNPFLQNLATAKTARELATKLYQFLHNAGVEQRLLQWRDAAMDRGDLFAAKQPEQVWTQLMAVLDDFVAIFDEQHDMAISDLQVALQTAFETAKYSAVPSTMDQVTVSESGIVQMQTAKYVFIFGATNKNLPVTIRQHALLQDDDRLILQTLLPDGVSLRETADAEMAQDAMLIYNAMMSGREKLIWVYATSDGDNSTQAASYVKTFVRGMGITVTVIPALPAPDDQSDAILWRLGSVQSTLANLVVVNRQAAMQNTKLSGAWQQLTHLLTRLQPDYYARIMAALNYRNTVEQIKPALVTALFGNDLKASISRLETYSRNPFEYFLRYGLGLQPRQAFDVTPAETGSFMHAILENVFQKMMGRELGSVSNAELVQLETQAAQEILQAGNTMFDVLRSSSRMQFLTQTLIEQVHVALLNMRRGQLPNAGIQTMGTETGFGIANGSFKSMTFDLGDGKAVTVRGKIDRFDKVHITTTPKNFLSIVDYKSGNRSFDYRKAFAGLELQLMTYWSAMLANLDQLPADTTMGSVAFWSLKNEVLKVGQQLEPAPYEDLLRQADEKRQTQGTYSGIILHDDDFLQQMVNEAVKSPYKIKFNKNGSVAKKGSDVTEPEVIDTLVAFNEAKIQEIAAKILAGQFELAPYRDNQSTGLQYSDFTSIMRFDAMMGDQYHDLPKWQKEDILAAMHDFLQKGAQN